VDRCGKGLGVRETLRGEDWRVGRGGSGERGYGMYYVRRVALCYTHAGHAGLRSTYRIPSEASELSRLTIRYSLGALLFPPLVFIQFDGTYQGNRPV